MAKRVVLAYSGGLDTSVAVRWMIENYGVEVITVACNLGQEGDWEGLQAKAFAAGAVEAIVVDCREEFARDFLVPSLKANALYEGRYPLVSALSRPVIVRHLVAAARYHGADAVAHGCTGKGNDQVRFEVATRALAPDLEILAPVRNWGMTREDVDRVRRGPRHPGAGHQGEAVLHRRQPLGPRHRVRRDGGPVGPPARGRVEHDHGQGRRSPARSWSASSRACPVSIDGRLLPLHELVVEMNDIVGAYGWGRLDMVENRRVGIKSRETYEAPGRARPHRGPQGPRDHHPRARHACTRSSASKAASPTSSTTACGTRR